MDYKKIIKSRKMRGRILNFLRFVPDKQMLKIQYRLKFGRKLNLKHPKRYTEKLQWYKLYYRNPIMKKCVNKYNVREYVTSKGLESILIPLYAHYKWVEDVEWDELPDSFVIKTQHGGGGLNVVLVPDKRKMSKADIVSKLSYSIEKVGEKSGGREWAYWGNPTGIVVEQLLVNEKKPDAGVNDYKIYCFSGIPQYIHVDVDRYKEHRRNFYDCDWTMLDLESEYPNYQGIIPKPKNFDRMLEYASKLSEGFPFVRVDLYNIDGVIYFGEMTFYPSSGYAPHKPDSWDYRFGEKFELISTNIRK